MIPLLSFFGLKQAPNRAEPVQVAVAMAEAIDARELGLPLGFSQSSSAHAINHTNVPIGYSISVV